VQSREVLSARPGDAVVCIIDSQSAGLERCLESVFAHTANEIALVICGGSKAVPSPRVGESEPRSITHADSLERALESTRPADVAVLSADCVVAEGWLDELRTVARSDSRVATVSALATGEGAERVAVPAEHSLGQAAATVRATSPRTHPRLEAPCWPCVYVRRSALELIGRFGNWDGFSSACLRSGLTHLVADEVLIGADDSPSHLKGQSPAAPLTRSLAGARRRVAGLSLLIDMRMIGAQTGGTQVHALELLGALGRAEGVRAMALVSDAQDPAFVSALAGASAVEVITVSEAHESGQRADVVHRPYQVGTPADLGVLGALGERLVVTQQDLIAYQNPFYFESRAHWDGYRAITRRALATADRVIFPSAHARDEALAEELVEPDRISVVRHGVDHLQVRREQSPVSAPVGADGLSPEAELMLCIGTDYWHKNRLFAIAILDELQRRHGWRGKLVLAGSHMRWGSSAAQESELLAQRPDFADAVVDLGEISEGEKEWLYSRATLSLYPTLHEGFGLVPFEAADHDVPCLWAKGTAISEVLPDSAAGIEPWDVRSSATSALALMRDARAREDNLRAIRGAAGSLRWDRAAQQLVEIYEVTCDRPPAPAGMRERQEGGLIGLSEDALRLVGPDGALPGELERPLLALATHRRVSRPVFGALKAGYLASARWRRRSARS
jgi:glycosyltransferase involved in cell wall biosynthesis